MCNAGQPLAGPQIVNERAQFDCPSRSAPSTDGLLGKQEYASNNGSNSTAVEVGSQQSVVRTSCAPRSNLSADCLTVHRSVSLNASNTAPSAHIVGLPLVSNEFWTRSSHPTISHFTVHNSNETSFQARTVQSAFDTSITGLNRESTSQSAQSSLPLSSSLVTSVSQPKQSSFNNLCIRETDCSADPVHGQRVRRTVRRIGVFYSDLCDVLKNMRSSPVIACSSPILRNDSTDSVRSVNEDFTPLSAKCAESEDSSNISASLLTSRNEPLDTVDYHHSPYLNTRSHALRIGGLPDLLHLPVPLHSNRCSHPTNGLTVAGPAGVATVLAPVRPLPSSAMLGTVANPPISDQCISTIARPPATLTMSTDPLTVSSPKPCLRCSKLGARWFVLIVAFIGCLCALLGAYLAFTWPPRSDQLPLALLLLGVGIVLMSISGLALRLGIPSHLTDHADTTVGQVAALEVQRRFLPRQPGGRTQHPYGAMFYPEFEYRPPPPTYQASMQEYRMRLMAMRRSHSQRRSSTLSNLLSGLSGLVMPEVGSRCRPAVSPPPTYNRSPTCSSLAGSLRRPPSYRTAIGTRNAHSISATMASVGEESIKPLEDEYSTSTPNINLPTNDDSAAHRVTIYQNATGSVQMNTGVNVVSVSPPSEMQILAHL